MLYVADTHALIWYLIGTLPKEVDNIFQSAEKGESIIYIPTIVLAECLYLVEDGKIDLDFDELLAKIETSRNFVPVSFSFEVLKALPQINLSELHDRIVVATARIIGGKLLTRDEEIKSSGLVEVIW